MRVGYIRISSFDSNENHQRKILEAYNIEKYYVEEVSAKEKKRPVRTKMLETLGVDDIIYVCSFNRLARNLQELRKLIDELMMKRVVLVSDKEKMDTSTETGKLQVQMIRIVADFEKENLKERQREGIAIAKSEGKYIGGKNKKVNLERYAQELLKYKNREITKAKMAENLHVSRPTLDKWLKDPILHSEAEANISEVEVKMLPIYTVMDLVEDKNIVEGENHSTQKITQKDAQDD